MISQAKEISRQCVEPPLKKKPNAAPFKPEPSLKKSVAFLIDCIKRIPKEHCGYCKQECFPTDPNVCTVAVLFIFAFNLVIPANNY